MQSQIRRGPRETMVNRNYGRFAALGLVAATCLLLGSAAGYAQSYTVPTTPSVQKRGATKNVSVELVSGKGGFMRKITTLKGAEFAAKEVAPPPGSIRDGGAGKFYDYLPPKFSPGDRNITIKIDPSAGFTELLGLKFFDPVVISIAPDGSIEADRPGVHALAFEGHAEDSGCFLAMAHEEGVYVIGDFDKPAIASDGSMVRRSGEVMTCHTLLGGKDGAPYISQQLMSGTQSRILFVPVASGQ